MSSRTPDQATGGRPRSREATAAILEAVIEILAEEGWEGLTMAGIAEEAGVAKTTIYRRWDSKEEVVVAALENFVADFPVPDTGTLAGDLRDVMIRAVDAYQGIAGRIVPSLVGAMAKHERLAETVRAEVLAERRKAMVELLERGVERGEIPEDADLELMLDFLNGPLFYRLLITGEPTDEAFATDVVARVLDGFGAGTNVN